MSEDRVIPTGPEHGGRIDAATRERMYRRSIEDPEGFWRDEAHRLAWTRFPKRIKDASFDGDVHIRWFEDGVLNACVNCLDRHLEAHGDRTAILFESDEPGKCRSISYRELFEEVCRMANVLKKLGVGRGNRVTIYLPMIPQAVVAMLACARIGAVHSVVFAGFSPDALKGRILDADSHFLITADEGVRGGKRVPLKRNADQALAECPDVRHVLVVRRTGAEIAMQEGRDVWWHELRETVAADCPAEEMGAEDPLFILYTSGSTGRPKGVLHTTGGYLLHAAMSFDLVFAPQPDEIFWCTADVGWVTGHSYIVYGPLANGATVLLFEGVPTWPDIDRFWEVIERHRVNIFYTAPTAIRALMRHGDEPVRRHDLSSLRLIGTVGEPINPEAWEWYYRVVGGERCYLVDTWWQTETGGIMITGMPGAVAMKPGRAGRPFFGVRPALVDASGGVVAREGDAPRLEEDAEGSLVILDSWPGQARSVFGDHRRFVETYFSTYPGKYFTGDGARLERDGFWRIMGRVDDVINVSGHRLGTAEIESALVEHPAVAEAAVVGFPHDIKGQGIYAFVTPVDGITPNEALAAELKAHVAAVLSPIARPDHIQFADALPKTRSGKIMRRILRKIAEGDPEHLGDTSTLAEPEVVPRLVAERLNR
ncbi:MAG: acetate--CoA ligase [Alphaproteobacteria bacterium]|nr:MAG: acetate--CoA ligase [Alphaproteobacteria bacterium]